MFNPMTLLSNPRAGWPEHRPTAPIMIAMPKPVDERDRDEAIAALDQLNADFDDICRAEVRLAGRKRRVILARAARKAQIDVLESFERMTSEQDDALAEALSNDNLDAGFDTSASDAPVEVETLRLESEMSVVEVKEAAE